MSGGGRARLRVLGTGAVLVALLTAAACNDRGQHEMLPAIGADDQALVVQTTDLTAGGASEDVAVRNPYGDEGRATAEGRELYNAMNCGGCHGPQGGGGIGPPFADAGWIYGGEPENIVASILRGRPNGMPAFGGKLPQSEAWKIAVFVRSLSKHGSGGSGDSPTMGSGRGTSTAGGRE